jgi:hypothetical protein
MLSLFTGTMLAQAPAEPVLSRVLPFTHADSAPLFQEMATVIRSVGEIRNVSIDAAQRNFTVHGSAGQIALAEWLFNELDRSPGTQRATAQEYRYPGSAENAVRVFYLTHDANPRRLQEITVVIRSIAEIRRAFTYSGLNAIIMRGTPDQMQLADWLFRELDRSPAARQSGPHEYRYLDPREGFVRIFYFKQTTDLPNLQEIATVIRSTGEIRRAFLYAPGGALVMYGTADQMRLAEWLFNELDQPSGKTRAAREYWMTGDGDDPVVRVLYMPATQTAQAFQDSARELRTKTSLRRFFTYGANRAIVLRGTAEQAALGEQIAASRTAR